VACKAPGAEVSTAEFSPSMRRTSISGAIEYARIEIDLNEFKGLRRVIDISGDGPNNDGTPVERARDRALSDGLVINGLPLMTYDGTSPWGIPDLDRYYEACVIGGPGAFVVPVLAWEDFPMAVRRKIVLELDAKAKDWLAETGYDPVYGARPLKRVIQRELQNPLAEMILAGKVAEGQTVQVSAGEGHLLINGEAVKTCLTLAVQADGCEVTTIEGLAKGDKLHALQEAFNEHHALQCGYCTPGILMNMTEFLEKNPRPSEEEIREALIGNLCRCTGYAHIVEAVKDAAAKTGG